ncbi:glycosyltransferase [Trichlorobacter ammonificans]|uniref:Glycosyltransferase n=1 Tax=Trichlorobacter ammonificans TaxID=2916410 RepID=A0ABM9D8H9_9BACT|nr:glycosyltransferase [Trichlorobacter ammonificans]CAH2031392.1 conserved protein of unknown function [Trichlorobacter ammonificans]
MTTDRTVRVVQITQYLEIGGLESLIMELCRSLDRSRFTPSVLCLNGYDPQYAATLEHSGVAVHLVTKRHRRDLLFLQRAASLLRRLGTDVVHSHGGCFLYGSLIGRLAGARLLVHTLHGMPVERGLQARCEERLACALTDRIVAVSDGVAADILSRNPAAAHKVTTVINGIDTERFKPLNDPRQVSELRRHHGLPTDTAVIGSVGRLEAVKNYPLLLRACAELRRSRGIPFHLVLVGSGSEEVDLKQLAAELGIGQQVSFPGMCYDLQEVYPTFDLFALSSLTEGTSLSLLEALSCGVPAVVTAVGGNCRIVQHGVNGYLCRSGDQGPLALFLGRLLRDEEERRAMGVRARSVIRERFALGGMVAAYQELYRDGAVAAPALSPEAELSSYEILLP